MARSGYSSGSPGQTQLDKAECLETVRRKKQYSSSHLNKPLQRNWVLRMNCTVRNHRIVSFENTIAHEFIEGVLCSFG